MSKENARLRLHRSSKAVSTKCSSLANYLSRSPTTPLHLIFTHRKSPICLPCGSRRSDLNLSRLSRLTPVSFRARVQETGSAPCSSTYPPPLTASQHWSNTPEHLCTFLAFISSCSETPPSSALHHSRTPGSRWLGLAVPPIYLVPRSSRMQSFGLRNYRCGLSSVLVISFRSCDHFV